jgi:hypothetical protein
MNTLAIMLLPAGMTLIAVTTTLGVYGKHMRYEARDADTLRFVRQLGLCNVVFANIVATVLILLCARCSALTVVTAVICGLAGSGTVSSMRFRAEPVTPKRWRRLWPSASV